MVLTKIDREEVKEMKRQEEALIREANELVGSQTLERSLERKRAWLNKYEQWVSRAASFSKRVQLQENLLSAWADSMKLEIEAAERHQRGEPPLCFIARKEGYRSSGKGARSETHQKT